MFVVVDGKSNAADFHMQEEYHKLPPIGHMYVHTYVHTCVRVCVGVIVRF